MIHDITHAHKRQTQLGYLVQAAVVVEGDLVTRLDVGVGDKGHHRRALGNNVLGCRVARRRVVEEPPERPVCVCVCVCVYVCV